VFYPAPSPDYWLLQSKKVARPLSSVVLPCATKDSLIEDVERFVRSESWYQAHGIPYRRGYLLYGSPGTGKTSFIIALAGHLKRLICVLPLTDSHMTDSLLLESFNTTMNKAIIVVEDIDCALVPNMKRRKKGELFENRVTLSGLLNCIDGIGSREGSILFFTTNHPEQLSPALLRPGRIDKKFLFGLASKEQCRTLFEQFFPQASKEETLSFVSAILEGTFSVAELQGIFVAHRSVTELLASLPQELETILAQRRLSTLEEGEEAKEQEEEEEEKERTGG